MEGIVETQTSFPRRAPRKNLMLFATIEAAGISAPVRVRNLSADGAMIDGGALPDPGSQFLLRRLELAVQAEAVWKEGGRCGLKLAHTIEIDDWIAGVAKPKPGASLGQLRVDSIQQAVRSGQALPTDDRLRSDEAARPAAEVDLAIAAELARVKATLDAVGEALSDDIEVLMKFEQALQEFDIANATVAELAQVMAASDRAGAVKKVAMHDLRNRLSGQASLT